MKKIIAVICILIVGFAGGFYLSRSSLFSSFAKQSPVSSNSARTSAANTSNQTTDTAITEDDAKAIALHDADVTPNGIYNMRAHAENYYGVDIYDVEFDTEDKQYNYNIDRQNGNVLAMDYEVDERYLRTMPDNFLSEQQAVDLAVRNIPGAQPSDIQLRRDHDDDYLEYEGRAVINNISYEFTINGDKGIITEWDIDYKTH